MTRGSGDGGGAPRRVLVADDQPVAVAGAVRFLDERGFEALPPVTDVRRLSDAVREHHPDVVLIDPAMNDRGTTLSTIAALVGQSPGARVLGFLGDASPVAVEAALDSGCLGVVPKTCTPDALADAAEQVARGERHLHPRAIAALLQRRQAADTLRSMRALSARELSVLQLIAEGRTNADIAADLGVSDATVKTHVAHILRKLQAEDRAHAVSRGLRLGLFA